MIGLLIVAVAQVSVYLEVNCTSLVEGRYL